MASWTFCDLKITIFIVTITKSSEKNRAQTLSNTHKIYTAIRKRCTWTINTNTTYILYNNNNNYNYYSTHSFFLFFFRVVGVVLIRLSLSLFVSTYRHGRSFSFIVEKVDENQTICTHIDKYTYVVSSDYVFTGISIWQQWKNE